MEYFVANNKHIIVLSTYPYELAYGKKSDVDFETFFEQFMYQKTAGSHWQAYVRFNNNVLDWFSSNVKYEHWSTIPSNYMGFHPNILDQGFMIRFDNKEDAMLFKLTWS